MKRSVKHFKAFFANIFYRKRKKYTICQTHICLLRDSCSVARIEVLLKIARTLFQLDAPFLLGQKRQLEGINHKTKALT